MKNFNTSDYLVKDITFLLYLIEIITTESPAVNK